MRFGCTAEVLAECELKYYKISECHARNEFPDNRRRLQKTTGRQHLHPAMVFRHLQ